MQQVNSTSASNYVIKLSLAIVSFFLCTQAVLLTIDLGFALWNHLESSPYFGLRANISTIGLALTAVLYTGIRCVEDAKGNNNGSPGTPKGVTSNALVFGLIVLILGIFTVNQAWATIENPLAAESGKLDNVDERVLAFLYLLMFSIGAGKIAFMFKNAN
jgi:hypothetical protein